MIVHIFLQISKNPKLIINPNKENIPSKNIRLDYEIAHHHYDNSKILDLCLSYVENVKKIHDFIGFYIYDNYVTSYFNYERPETFGKIYPAYVVSFVIGESETKKKYRKCHSKLN